MPKRRAPRPTPPARGAHVALVVAQWNAEITDRLAAGALEAARRASVSVERFDVAGSFELPAAVALVAETGRYDAVVPLGCLIRGETPHFGVLADAIAIGLMELSLSYPVAVTFGVLTCDTLSQARARAGGRKGNKGAETMEAALALVSLRKSFARTR